jgi:hypothetical protein
LSEAALVSPSSSISQAPCGLKTVMTCCGDVELVLADGVEQGAGSFINTVLDYLVEGAQEVADARVVGALLS